MKARRKSKAPAAKPANRREDFFARWWAGKGPVIRFTLRFAGWSALIFALSLTPFFKQAAAWNLDLNARIAGALLNVLGQSAHTVDNNIVSGPFAMVVKPECTAGELLAFFCAALLALPGSWQRKIVGVIVGTAAIALLNLVRITTVFFIGAHHPDFFTALHEEVWPGVLVMATLMLLLAGCVWMRKEARPSSLPFRPGFFALAFCLLLIPWPGWSARCGDAFQNVGTKLFYSPEGNREITFEAQDAHTTRLMVVNRSLMNPDGSGPVRNLDLNTIAFLWRPFALLLALAIGTCINTRDRLWALGLALLCLAVYLVAVLVFALWHESTEVSLVTLSPNWKAAAIEVQAVMLRQLTLAAPALLWFWAAVPAVFRPGRKLS
jgi:exosortase/archaeosortase family protein